MVRAFKNKLEGKKTREIIQETRAIDEQRKSPEVGVKDKNNSPESLNSKVQCSRCGEWFFCSSF